MQVYVELALAENFCMDFCLLYCTKLLTKNTCSIKRVAISSLLGAVFAVAITLFSLSSWLAITFKLLCGVLLAAIAGKFSTFKSFIKFAAIFFAFTFLLGGGLLGMFWLAGIDYVEGEGYLISSVPIGIPLFCGLILIIISKKFAAKIRAKCSRNLLKINVIVGDKSAQTSAFFDSGNNVYYMGQPVCIVPLNIAKKLVDVKNINNFVYVHTVAGKQKMAIFTADKIAIECDGQVKLLYKVKLGISPNPINMAVMHPDFAEVN